MGVAENEDAHMDFLRPEHIKTLMLVKIRAFGAMIKTTRDKTIELYHKKKISSQDAKVGSASADLMMQEEEKKQAASIN